MRRGRRQEWRQRLYPVIGLVTIVALGLFVYVSYTANGGLPFTASYDLRARVADAERLIRTDEVRIAGVRVGQVSSVSALLRHDGQPYSVIGLALSPSVGRLPIDTLIEVQSSSVLGQTYVDLIPGRSATKVPSGGTLPLRDFRPVVQLTDLLDIFDRSTARAIQSTIGGLGYGLAGRGAELNDTLASLPGLLGSFSPVARALAAPATNLAGFLHGFEAVAAALAPVAAPLGGLVANGSATFGAIAAERAPLGRTVDALPGAEDATSTALVELRGPVAQLAALTTRLRAGAALLPSTVAGVNATLRAGIRPLDGLPRFSSTLSTTLDTLRSLSSVPTTPGALRQLTSALQATGPLLGALTPAQLDCNVIGLYGRNFSSAWGSIGTGIGPSYVIAGVVTAGALGEELQSAKPAGDLHINYLPHENASECESGNEPYSTTAADLSNPPGDQSRSVPRTS